jgi:hypothetical protein
VAKGNSKSATPGSVGKSSEHKVAILNALNALQECHEKDGEMWTTIEAAKQGIESETREDVLLEKRRILGEEFKKELADVFDAPK